MARMEEKSLLLWNLQKFKSVSLFLRDIYRVYVNLQNDQIGVKKKKWKFIRKILRTKLTNIPMIMVFMM